jgi:hypothetical protein
VGHRARSGLRQIASNPRIVVLLIAPRGDVHGGTRKARAIEKADHGELTQTWRDLILESP